MARADITICPPPGPKVWKKKVASHFLGGFSFAGKARVGRADVDQNPRSCGGSIPSPGSICCGIDQLADQGAHNLCVVGSSPAPATIYGCSERIDAPAGAEQPSMGGNDSAGLSTSLGRDKQPASLPTLVSALLSGAAGTSDYFQSPSQGGVSLPAIEGAELSRGLTSFVKSSDRPGAGFFFGRKSDPLLARLSRRSTDGVSRKGAQAAIPSLDSSVRERFLTGFPLPVLFQGGWS